MSTADIRKRSNGGQSFIAVDDLNRLLTSEPAIQGVVAMTVGTSYPVGRQLQVVCTAAGNISVQMADGSTNIVPVGVGLTTFPWAVTQVNSTGTTATATYSNLV